MNGRCPRLGYAYARAWGHPGPAYLSFSGAPAHPCHSEQPQQPLVAVAYVSETTILTYVVSGEERSEEESAFDAFKVKQVPLPPRRSKLGSALRMRDRDDRLVGAVGDRMVVRPGGKTKGAAKAPLAAFLWPN